eukprot:363162-Chlamydomonas_euryale.AAC.6
MSASGGWVDMRVCGWMAPTVGRKGRRRVRMCAGLACLKSNRQGGLSSVLAVGGIGGGGGAKGDVGEIGGEGVTEVAGEKVLCYRWLNPALWGKGGKTVLCARMALLAALSPSPFCTRQAFRCGVWGCEQAG